MKFKVDENLPEDAGATLREFGFDVETVRTELLSGADDQTIAERVTAEERILLTLDLDFSNIRAYPPEQYFGIVVLRTKTQDRATVLAYIRRFAQVAQQRSPVGELWIVERDRIRIRQAS